MARRKLIDAIARAHFRAVQAQYAADCYGLELEDKWEPPADPDPDLALLFLFDSPVVN